MYLVDIFPAHLERLGKKASGQVLNVTPQTSGSGDMEGFFWGGAIQMLSLIPVLLVPSSQTWIMRFSNSCKTICWPLSDMMFFFGDGINFMISRADFLISPYLLSFQSSVQHISFVSVISWPRRSGRAAYSRLKQMWL